MEISYRLFQWDDIDEIVSIICDTMLVIYM